MSEVTRFVVEVVPDVTGIDRTFDYFVPDELKGSIEVGCKVRVNLNGRRVGGWVVSCTPNMEPNESELKPILKFSGIGPDATVVSLSRWAANRWCVGKLRPFLVTASPHTVVSRASPSRRTKVVASPVSPAASELLREGGGVLRLPPTHDQLPAVLSAAHMGPTLVVCATVDASRVMAARLKRAGISVALMPHEWNSARGGVDVVIGARSAAFAPCPDLAAAVVLDEHEESLQEERMPTWHAREILAERCRENDAPLLLISASPTVVGSHSRKVLAPPPERERAGWPSVEVIDRSAEPVWSRSLVSAELIDVLRDRSLRVVCISNTKGLARLLGCRSCGDLVRCEACSSTLVELEDGRLECPVCHLSRPPVCAVCSSTAISRLRPGVTRLREELEKAANRPVAKIESGDIVVDEASHDVFVGTSATLHRIHRADVVVFLDFDRELLAPRFQAHEQAMALLVRAARLVGPRNRKGRILIQTSFADHDVVRAAVEGNPAILTEAETERRRDLGLPPFSTLAVVEGDGVDRCVEGLANAQGLVISRHRGRAIIRAVDHRSLSDAWASLSSVIRSTVRIEVDPLSM
ncbi:MAG: putative primosomal protein n [Actinomycetota bacterium]|jgi:primosomal protein N' (replication factor Y)